MTNTASATFDGWLFARAMAPEAELRLIMILTVVAIPAALALASLIRATRKLAGTTLVAPVLWATISLVAVVGLETMLLRSGIASPVRSKIDFLAATLTFCPLVALLGAKRPQDRAWQFIVLGFWCVAALPAVQSLLIHPSEDMSVHGLWQLLLAMFILLEIGNYLPTRFAGPVVLAVLGQCALLGDYLPGSSAWFVPIRSSLMQWLPEFSSDGKSAGLRMWQFSAGIASLALAICWAYGIAVRRQRKQSPLLHGWNRVWSDFRHSYGLLWGMRIVERMGVTSYVAKSPVRLSWNGFHAAGASLQAPAELQTEATSNSSPGGTPSSLAWPETIGPIEADFRSLLVRFVSNRWIDRRLAQPPE